MERVILVGVFRKGQDPLRDEASFSELHRLTETAGGSVAATVTQRVERPNPRSLIGSGKVQELAQAVARHKVRTVIFDEELTPAQHNHLEKELKAKVVDRTRLILDIFAQRARTKEGELQVELAQLNYMLPRLTGAWRGYSQQVGGIGTRGPGERQLEYERRHIQYRIAHLKRDIERMEVDRAQQRRRREAIPVPSVAIIGYTNAGKSSLLNRLTRASGRGGRKAVYADDKLFATLDPTTRRVRLPQGGEAVFTDTVGFISKLPTTLIAAFRSTLEEVSRADCLLLVEDGGSRWAQEQRQTVLGVLEDLEAGGIPRVAVCNKADLLDPEERGFLSQEDPSRLFISALSGEGLPEMLDRIQAVLNERWLLRELSLPCSRARHLDAVYRSAQVLSQSAEGDRIALRLRVTPENWKRLVHRLKSGD